MSAAVIIVAIALGLVIVFAVYAVTMYIYCYVRSRCAHRRYLAEIAVIAVVVFLSFVIRLAALLSCGAVTFGGTLGEFFRAVYMAIGGLTFEGLEGTGSLPAWAAVLYYGVTLHAGLVALSVITARVSYEIFSTVRYAFTQLFCYRRRCDVYLFTAVTEDALLLAESIEQKYREKPKADAAAFTFPVGIAGERSIPFKEKRRCLIVFSGNEIGPFDHKNELHRAIMGRGYYYMSFGKRRKKEEELPLTQKLHFAVVNDPSAKGEKPERSARRYRDARRHVFALRQGKALTGEEASNSDFVFDDIRAALRRLPDAVFEDACLRWVSAAGDQSTAVAVPAFAAPTCLAAADAQCKEAQATLARAETARKNFASAFMQNAAAAVQQYLYTVVDYHILTDDEINYQFYETELCGILSEQLSARLQAAFEALLSRDEVRKTDPGSAVNDPFAPLREQYFAKEKTAAGARLFEAEARRARAELVRQDGERLEKQAKQAYAAARTEENRRKMQEAAEDLRVYEDELRQAQEDVVVCRRAADSLNALGADPGQAWFVAAVAEDERLLGRVRRAFQLHIFNEAQLAARDFSVRRTEAYRREDEAEAKLRKLAFNDLPWTERLFHRDVAVSARAAKGEAAAEGPLYRAVVLGFGKTAQCAMNALLVQTSAVDKEGRPTQFVADVYDRAADERSGLFAYTHPLYQCFRCEDCLPPDAKKLQKMALALDDTAHRVLYDRYRDFAVPPAPRLRRGASKTVNKLMGFPRICFHKASCFDLEFMRMLDTDISGDGSPVKSEVRAFIVCLGSDEANIRMANALIDDFKHEAYAHGPADGRPSLQTVYVHIRDEKNSHRLNWTEEDEAFFRRSGRRLVVVRFGNREAMYSYDDLLEERPAEYFNFLYDRFSAGISAENKPAWAQNMTDLLQKAKDYPDDPVDLDGYKNLPIFGEVLQSGREKLRDRWLDTGAYLKQSNESVVLFEVVYEGLLSQKGLHMNELLRIVRLEKVRWNRFYMSNGWVYGEPDASATKRMRRRGKEHDGLCPFEMFSRAKDKKGTAYILYDAANVLLALGRSAEKTDTPAP